MIPRVKISLRPLGIYVHTKNRTFALTKIAIWMWPSIRDWGYYDGYPWEVTIGCVSFEAIYWGNVTDRQLEERAELCDGLFEWLLQECKTKE